MSARNIHLLMIDPQRDFCQKANQRLVDLLRNAGIPQTEWPCDAFTGALFVPGADEDMARLAPFIVKNKDRFSEVHCTLDSHQLVHIAHPIFWVNSKGEHPNIFTIITVDDVKNGVWRAFNPRFQKRALAYVEALAVDDPKNGHPKRYDLCIWPPHCLIGTWGHCVVPSVAAALAEWEVTKFNRVNYVTKGSNFLTEHYSGIQADVEDPNDVSTKLNTGLIDVLTEADEIVTTGEALSHCVANTVRDVAAKFGVDNVRKFTLLQDTTSNVLGFEKLGRDFVMEMAGKGMRLTTTKDW